MILAIQYLPAAGPPRLTAQQVVSAQQDDGAPELFGALYRRATQVMAFHAKHSPDTAWRVFDPREAPRG